jgi:50S ribosomal subunit-associated GTPase HflX
LQHQHLKSIPAITQQKDTLQDMDDFNLDFSLKESMAEISKLPDFNSTARLPSSFRRSTPIETGTDVKPQNRLGEINGKARASLCCTVVFDMELTPGQQKGLENALNKKVIKNDFLCSNTVTKEVD